jgi:hypothetical protein
VLFALLVPGVLKRAFGPPRRTKVPTPYQAFFVTTEPPPPPPPAGVDVANAGWSGQAAEPMQPMQPMQPQPLGDTLPTRGGSALPRLLVGLAGTLLVVVGLHGFVGGMVGTITEALNPLQPPCDGPHCAVGIDAGWLGLTFGIPATIAGFAIRSTA